VRGCRTKPGRLDAPRCPLSITELVGASENVRYRRCAELRRDRS
jgi:hypothetical protein